MLTSKQAAEYILSLSDPDVGDYISNLKLQKLLYYCQGFYLALYGKPLFNEPIYAWALGPVVNSIYKKYRDNGKDAIQKPLDINFSVYSKKEKELMNEVYNVYGQFSAWKLSQMTHSEYPWKNTKQNDVIEHNILKKFFVTLINHS